jgi:predicted nucleic acid-binding protein
LVDAAAERRTHGYVSTAVLEEVWHLELSGSVDGLDGATANLYEVFSPLLAVTDEVFRKALDIDGATLGSNDRIHVATCQEWGIRTIVSADVAFDSVRTIRRVDPLDSSAIARLLRT